MFVAAGAVIIQNNTVGRYWSRYYTKQHGLSPLGPLFYLTTWLVAPGAVIVLNNMVGRYWGWSFVYSTTMLVAAEVVIILNNIVGRNWRRCYTLHYGNFSLISWEFL